MLNGCDGPSVTTSFGLQVPEPRYLTGEEQKSICELAVNAASSNLGLSDSSGVRCVVLDQVSKREETHISTL